MTTIYLIRHSKPQKINKEAKDDLQTLNERVPLSTEGEQIAKEKLSNSEFNNIDAVYSSNYERAIQTANYLFDKVTIIDSLGERRFGIKSWDELPQDFERNQLLDDNYKLKDGESQKEVRERMYKALLEILNNNKGKRVAIVSHGTAISFLLKIWCDINIENDKIKYIYKDKILLNNYFDYCETFKLEFDQNNNLLNIEHINL
jgi:broad specificity phosphatase PhoE